MVKLLDQNALLIDLLADLLALHFEPACNFVNFVEVLVLLLDQLVLHALHASESIFKCVYYLLYVPSLISLSHQTTYIYIRSDLLIFLFLLICPLSLISNFNSICPMEY